jgi:hypothetical protein
MMNYLLRIITVLLIVGIAISCNSDNAQECFKTAGDSALYDIPVAAFSSIHVGQGIELVIAEGPEQRVTVQTGSNLKEYITATVVDGQLRLKNNVNCNWVRGYNNTTITVTTPTLTQIVTATQWNVRSAGTLHYPQLNILSGIYEETASAIVNLEMDSQNLTIDDNQNLYCIISGHVENLNVNFYAGDARFDGRNLDATNVNVFHRSSNDIIVQATNQVTGTVYATGNLVLVNHPPTINVNTTYTGRVVYE